MSLIPSLVLIALYTRHRQMKKRARVKELLAQAMSRAAGKDLGIELSCDGSTVYLTRETL